MWNDISAGQCGTALRSATSQCSTVERSGAEQSTSEHGKAHHSTVQQSTSRAQLVSAPEHIGLERGALQVLAKLGNVILPAKVPTAPPSKAFRHSPCSNSQSLVPDHYSAYLLLTHDTTWLFLCCLDFAVC